jgi:hypothetical protein
MNHPVISMEKNTNTINELYVANKLRRDNKIWKKLMGGRCAEGHEAHFDFTLLLSFMTK